MGEVESFLVFGSNLGDRYGFIRKSFDSITHFPEIKLLGASGIYETEPVEVIDQPLFLNAAAHISTSLSPVELLTRLKEVEISLGRIERARWREREIDIDIIFFGNEIIESTELTIPHPRSHQRRFVLQPLNEIASSYIHPVFRKTVGQLLLECKDNSAVIRVEVPLSLVN